MIIIINKLYVSPNQTPTPFFLEYISEHEELLLLLLLLLLWYVCGTNEGLG
jgi:hypothetical protein